MSDNSENKFFKSCSKCKLELDLSLFNRNKSKHDGLQCYCKDCSRKIIVAHYEKHGGRHINPETAKIYRARTYLRNKDKILERTKEWAENNKEKVKEYKRKWADNNYLLKKLRQAEKRAKDRGLNFDLTVDDLVLTEKCPILNIPLLQAKDHDYKFRNAPSIDKIIPELGYIKGNVQIISNKANTMKNDATVEELLLFAEWVIRTFKNS